MGTQIVSYTNNVNGLACGSGSTASNLFLINGYSSPIDEINISAMTEALFVDVPDSTGSALISNGTYLYYQGTSMENPTIYQIEISTKNQTYFSDSSYTGFISMTIANGKIYFCLLNGSTKYIVYTVIPFIMPLIVVIGSTTDNIGDIAVASDGNTLYALTNTSSIVSYDLSMWSGTPTTVYTSTTGIIYNYLVIDTDNGYLYALGSIQSDPMTYGVYISKISLREVQALNVV